MLNVPSELYRQLVQPLDDAELLARLGDVPTAAWQSDGFALDDAARLELFDLKNVAQHRNRTSSRTHFVRLCLILPIRCSISCSVSCRTMDNS